MTSGSKTDTIPFPHSENSTDIPKSKCSRPAIQACMIAQFL